jgi:Holliday junction resolvase
LANKKNYNAGRDFEYKVRDYLREKGWIVRRAYASKGMFDLIAYKDGDNGKQIKWGIQAKSLKANNNKKYLTPKENRELCEYSLNPTEDYEFIEWKQSHRCPVMQILKDQFTVIHAYNMFPNIGWRINKKGEWKDLNNF